MLPARVPPSSLLAGELLRRSEVDGSAGWSRFASRNCWDRTLRQRGSRSAVRCHVWRHFRFQGAQKCHSATEGAHANLRCFAGQRSKFPKSGWYSKSGVSLCRGFWIVPNLLLYSFKSAIFEGAKEQVVHFYAREKIFIEVGNLLLSSFSFEGGRNGLRVSDFFARFARASRGEKGLASPVLAGTGHETSRRPLAGRLRPLAGC